MKRHSCCLFLVVVLEIGAMCVHAAAWNPTGTWNYRIINGAAEICSDGGPVVTPSPIGTVNIPATIDGYPVVSIGDNAFHAVNGITDVFIPDGVINIGRHAFDYCRLLSGITIPDSVMTISSSAFAHCNALSDTNGIAIVKGIFYYYGEEESVTVPEAVTTIGAYAFAGCDNLSSVAIPSSVTNIGEQAFSHCGRLAEVKIPNSVVCIEDGAFAYCSGVTNFVVSEDNPYCKSERGLILSKDGKTLLEGVNGKVSIPDGVTCIRKEAFLGRRELTSVSIPASVTNIEESAFADCGRLESIVVAEENLCYLSREGLLLSKDGKNLLRGICGDVTIPDGVTRIAECAFQGCGGLNSLTIPDGVTEASPSVFDGCTGLRSLTFRGDVPQCERCFPWGNIKRVMFPLEFAVNWLSLCETYGIEEIYPIELLDKEIKEEVVDGHTWRFYDGGGGAVICAGKLEPAVLLGDVVDRIKIPEVLGGLPVTEIGCAAFSGLSVLESVDVPCSVTNIADYAFYMCGGVDRVILPSALQSIGAYAFAYCGKLSEVVFGEPSSLVRVGKSAFQGCRLLAKSDFRLPESVVEVGENINNFMKVQYLGGHVYGLVTFDSGRVYIVTNDLTIAEKAALTIEPGVVLKFLPDVSFKVSPTATLNANGTRAQPIVFTSYRDDENGGDSNGDGDATHPSGGDWQGIIVEGSANLRHCRAMYGGPYNETGILETSVEGTLNLDACIVAHSAYDGIWNWSGSVVVKNTVVFDTGWATAPYRGLKNEFVNCVFYGNDVGVNYWQGWEGTPIYRNCVFANCFNGWCGLGSQTYGDPPDAVNVANCLFWNPKDYGPQECGVVGAHGNVWGDPCFRDAEKLDFRTKKGSACIDMGDSSSAPELDFNGQPRSEAADIGIYEAVGDGYVALNDLAVVDVEFEVSTRRGTGNEAGEVSAHVGDMIRVTYKVVNVGAKPVSGAWRDKVSLVLAESYLVDSVDLGVVVSEGVLGVGATNTFSAAFFIPPKADCYGGKWYVRVDGNVERDVFEGANVSNNASKSETVVAVTIPVGNVSGVNRGRAAKDAPACVKFMLDGAMPMVAKIDAPAGTVVYIGNDFVPDVAKNLHSANVTIGENGGVVGISSNVKSVCFVIESSSPSGIDFSITIEPVSMAVQSVSPATLPSSGVNSLIVEGANFADVREVALVSPDGGDALVAPATVVVPPLMAALARYHSTNLTAFASPTRLWTKVDCSRLSPGTAYSVAVIATNGVRATLADAVVVTGASGVPKLNARFEMPKTVRRGRTVMTYIHYENVGNADMPVPIFKVRSDGQVFNVDGQLFSNQVEVVGLSSRSPLGVLRPGEKHRMEIPMTVLTKDKTVRSSFIYGAISNINAHENLNLFTVTKSGWYMKLQTKVKHCMTNSVGSLARHGPISMNGLVSF
ncbi:MAG: leucine-rich repeat domain-containing protein [Kiritimatiellae bacterium]|nr:leucine-rich repeat domain-containing protein [Kiritimatiellia bacterium]